MRFYNTKTKSLTKDAISLYKKGIPFTYYTTIENIEVIRTEIINLNKELKTDT